MTAMQNPSAANGDRSESGGQDALARFLAEGTRRRAQQPSVADDERTGDWALPDADALARLAESRHPVGRVVARQTQTPRLAQNFKGRIRQALERLTDSERGTRTWADVLAFAWHHLTVEDAAEYRRAVHRQYTKVTTRNDAISVLRRIVTECQRCGFISSQRRDHLLDELPTVAPGPSTRRRRLSPDDIACLLRAAAANPNPVAAARDSAIIAVFATTGIRSCELVGLDSSDWDEDGRTLLLQKTKNGRSHLVFVHPVAVAYLRHWLDLRPGGAGALFTPVVGHSTRHLHPKTVAEILDRITVRSGVRHFGSHDFRRTVATTLLRSHDASLVSKILNHKKLSSTLIYDLASDDEMRNAIATLGLPTTPECDESRPAQDESGDAA